MKNFDSLSLGELERLFFEIDELIQYIEKIGFDSKKSLLYLSNGDRILLKIFKENIPHLLGINIEYLKSTGLYSSRNSYDLLKEVIGNAYKLHTYVTKQNVIKYDTIFSEHIYEKIKVFKFNTKINLTDTELICKYDSTKTFTITDKNEKYDYIIVKKDEKTGTYGILGIVKSNDYYVPMTSLYFEDYESLKVKLNEIIKNQEVTLISGIKFYSNFAECGSYRLNENAKASKLDTLMQYKKDFGCIIDTTDDFKFLLESSSKHKNQHYSNYNLINLMIESIREGKLLDLNMFIGSTFYELAESINDYIVGNSANFNEEIGENYSKIFKERNELLEELNVLKEKYESLKTIHEETQRRLKAAEAEITDYEEKRDILLKLYTPSKK